MTSLTSLNLSGNMLCGVSTLSTADGPKAPDPYTAAALKAIVGAARKSGSLIELSLANNRVCGVWSDAYGKQQFGNFVADGISVLADLLRTPKVADGATGGADGRRMVLQRLDISYNTVGTTGAKIVYDAMRANHAGSSLVHLDMRGSQVDPTTDQHLRELAMKQSGFTLAL